MGRRKLIYPSLIFGGHLKPPYFRHFTFGSQELPKIRLFTPYFRWFLAAESLLDSCSGKEAAVVVVTHHQLGTVS